VLEDTPITRTSPSPFPPPVRVNDAVLGPLLVGASRKLAFQCRADLGGVTLEHLRDSSGEGLRNAMTQLPLDPARSLPVGSVGRPTIYGGPFLDHFGHMAAEGMHRIWPRTVFGHLADADVVFQAHEDFKGVRPAWFESLLALYGVPAERALILSDTTRFDQLYIPRQARVLGGSTLLEGYEALFPMTDLAAVGAERPDRLYVSRRKHMYSGSYLGESFIEATLADAGFTTVYPEEFRPDEMSAKLSAASAIVFAEGSAIHHIEACGKIGAAVFVIGRRHGALGRFQRVLTPLVDRWRIYEDAQTSYVSFEWDPRRDEPMRSKGCYFLDLPQVVADIAEFFSIDLPSCNDEQIRQNVMIDLLRFAADKRTTSKNTGDAELGALFRRFRQNEAVRNLLSPVKTG